MCAKFQEKIFWQTGVIEISPGGQFFWDTLYTGYVWRNIQLSLGAVTMLNYDGRFQKREMTPQIGRYTLNLHQMVSNGNV